LDYWNFEQHVAGEIPKMSDNDFKPAGFESAEPSALPEKGFSPAQMIQCESCGRATPPTRFNCIYCGAGLSRDELASKLQRPQTRKLQEVESGFNVVAPKAPAGRLTEQQIYNSAELLRLAPDVFTAILGASVALPLARFASQMEAELVVDRLAQSGLELLIVPDTDLGIGGSTPVRARQVEFRPDGFSAASTGGAEWHAVAWTSLSLLVVGRIVESRVEVEQRKGSDDDSEIQTSRELSADESMLDIYYQACSGPLRINAGSFDFSCLGSRKALLAGANFGTLVSSFRAGAPESSFNDSYLAVRRLLDFVWPAEQKSKSGGWRRLSPGRYRTESVYTRTNEIQFTRYSNLNWYLRRHGFQ
jgi:hypothetical protein